MSDAITSNQSVDRTLQILRAIGDSSPSGARLTDVAERTGLSKATTHRMLAALAETGLIELDEAAGVFFLGFELWILASKAGSRYGLAELSDASLRRLTEKTSDTVYLQCRSGFEAVCLERHEGRFPIRTLTLSPGDRRPLGIGAGSLALLSALPDRDVERAIAANAEKIARFPGFEAAAIWELVEQTRRQGYSANEGRIVEGMHAVGVAILGGEGRPVGALSVAAIQSRMGADRRANTVIWLKQEAGEIEQKLGRIAHGAGPVGTERLLNFR